MSCKQSKQSYTIFDASLQTPEKVTILPLHDKNVTKIKLPQLKEAEMRASQLIDEVEFIFLETVPESLIGYYINVVMHKDHIFVLDNIIGNNIFIFDRTGKFLRSIPIGDGPGECDNVRGMFVDKLRDELVVYDMMRSKFMFYTLDGEFIGRSIDVQLGFCGEYAVMGSGEILYATDRSMPNSHVGDLQDYRLLYTDTLGCVQRATLFYDDNADLPTSWSHIFNGGDDILYYPKYTNDIYKVTDDGAELKYSIDVSAYSPVDIEYIQTSLHSYPELHKYLKEKTLLGGCFAETKDGFYFSTDDKGEQIYSFYNKKRKEVCSFKNLVFDTDLIIDFPDIFSAGERFIGTVSSQHLKELSENRKKEGHPLSKELEEKINNLREDDNGALVLFAVK